MQLSIILPTRNEEVLINRTLCDIASFLDKRKIVDYEILVVINGTTDTTDKKVLKMSSKNKRIKILQSKPGYGIALKKGLKEANGKYIAIFNVDFYDLRMLDLISVDLSGKDLIIGSKLTHWAGDSRPLSRRLISRLFNAYLKIAYGFRGSDTHGIKILRSTVVNDVLPRCKINSGIFDTEFVLRIQKLGYRIADFPVNVSEKRPPRFGQRILQTLVDIYELHSVFR